MAKRQSTSSRRGSSEESQSHVRNEMKFIEFIREGIGRRTMFLTAEFPFIYIGTIENIVEDYVLVDVDTAEQAVFEDRTWAIHANAIQAMYYEMEGFPRIPELND